MRPGAMCRVISERSGGDVGLPVGGGGDEGRYGRAGLFPQPQEGEGGEHSDPRVWIGQGGGQWLHRSLARRGHLADRFGGRTPDIVVRVAGHHPDQLW